MKSASVMGSVFSLITITFISIHSVFASTNTKGADNQIATASINSADSLALVALYNATNGANWTFNYNWLISPVAKWHGVKVTNDRVTEINLSTNNLIGNLPKEIGNLTGLINLYLYGNQLKGEIPPELGQLSSLVYLYLYSNQLSGSIPAELGALDKLQRLFLYANQLSGTIPPELGQLGSLEYLYLYSNQLSGSIPPEISALTNLKYLYLLNNQLTGSLPKEIGLLLNLNTLYISNNKLSGSIPTEIGQLTKLYYIYLQFNKLSGVLPRELGQLNNLYRIYLNNNNISGSIPSELGQLSRLQYLYLYNNQLSSNLPAELGDLSTLLYLDLSTNNLTDTIPTQLGKLSNLVELKLSTNQLNGDIPKTIGQLANLKLLELDRNELTGDIPKEINHLTNLETLSLTSNQLKGFLSDSLPNLPELSNIFIYYNNLTFEDLEDKMTLTDKYFYYSPQNKIGQSLVVQLDTGVNYTLNIDCGGTNNLYQWYFMGNRIGQESNLSSYKISNITFDDMGAYYCVISNSTVPGLILKSQPITLEFQPEGELAPTDIYLSNKEIDENLPVGSEIGALTSEDEDLFDAHTYSLVTGEGDQNNSSFFVSGDHLYSFEIFDYEKKQNYSIRIQTMDKKGFTFSKSFEISIDDIIELPPSDVLLSNNSLDENIDIGSLIGDLSTISTNLSQLFTYNLVSGEGDDDNTSFFISNDQLFSKKIFDFELKNSYQIRIETKDIDGLVFSKPFTILINDTQESEPTNIFLSNNTLDENKDMGTQIGTFTTESTSLLNTFTYKLVNGEGADDNASFVIFGDQLLSRVVFNYEFKSDYTIRVQTQDNQGGQFSTSFTISINDLNEAYSLVIPDAFSPNGDGKNDYYKIIGIEQYPNALIEIYNRYGSLVFYKENYGNANENNETQWWDGYQLVDGQRSSQPLPQGTYYLILVLDDQTIYKKSIFLKD